MTGRYASCADCTVRDEDARDRLEECVAAYTRRRLSEEKDEMVDRLMHVVEIWLEAQLTRLEALDDGRKIRSADSKRTEAGFRKHAVSLRCARCRAPFRTDEGRRRHLRAEPQCTVRDDAGQGQDPVEELEVGEQDVFRVLLRVKDREQGMPSQGKYRNPMT